MKQFDKAVVIGTGMMGPGIAATVALGGIPVTLISRTEAGAAEGVRKAWLQANQLIENGLGPGPGLAEITGSSCLEAAVANADLIIESAPESMTFKQELFAELDRISGPGAVLASNTSGLSITAIASLCRHPERVLTAHFWNPPHLMPLVEVVMGEKTAKSVAEDVMDLLRHCGKTPVLIRKDRPGQLGNRLQMALLREACAIVEQGIASVEDVDLAAKSGFGLRLPAYGIFEHQDAVGLDMGLGILDYIAADLYNEPHAPKFYREKVEEGKLGAKSGEGFYNWRERGAGDGIDAVKQRRDSFVLDVLKRSITLA